VRIGGSSETLADHMSRDPEPGVGSAYPSGAGGRVVPFKRRVPGRRLIERPIIDPLRHFEDEEDRRRMQQNLAAAIVIVLLITSGFWLIDHLRASARIEACVEAGHRNCVPLDPDSVQRR
jgi:hypothetical protein